STHRPRLRRSAWWRREHGPWREGASGSFAKIAYLLDRFTRQNPRGVLAAEAERVRHHGGDAGVARLVGDDVEGNRRIRNIVIDGRRNPLMLKRQQREHGFHRAGGGERVAYHRLVGRYRNLLGALAEHGRDAQIFH